VLLTVGFNRRFAPLSGPAREALAGSPGPALAVYRINAGPLPADHWLLDPVEGGGRIIGEGCHFFDLVCWLLGEEPRAVQAMGPLCSGGTAQELAVTIRLSGGSVGTILYTASGHPSVPKERIEIFKGGNTVVIDDFRVLAVNGRERRSHSDGKGYEAEIEAFLRAVRGEGPLEVTVQDGVRATTVALRALESALSGKTVTIDSSGFL
jgi:predicted dehydrogenase